MNRYRIHETRTLPEFYPGKRFKHKDRKAIYSLFSRDEYRSKIWNLIEDGMDRPHVLDSEEHLRSDYEPL